MPSKVQMPPKNSAPLVEPVLLPPAECLARRRPGDAERHDGGLVLTAIAAGAAEYVLLLGGPRRRCSALPDGKARHWANPDQPRRLSSSRRPITRQCRNGCRPVPASAQLTAPSLQDPRNCLRR